MRRPWIAWLVFALCVALAIGAMSRVDAMARRLERDEDRVRRQAALEESLQLALWRLDSELAPLVAEEATRPYFAYSSFYPAERAYTAMFAEIQKGDVLVPSPLLTYQSSRVLIHFQVGPDGLLRSPQVPTGNMRDLAEARYLSPETAVESARRLAELDRIIDRGALAAALDRDLPLWACATDELLAMPDVSNQSNAEQAYQANSEQAYQVRGSKEFQMRSRSSKLAQNIKAPEPPMASRAGRLSQGPMRALWIGPALLLARRVSVEEGTFLQGCWIDWEATRGDLLAIVSDLLPQPRLEPVHALGNSVPTRMLAALPVRLQPGEEPPLSEAGWSPVAFSLAIAWGGLGLLAVAVGVLLRGALALSERRGTFVSAVTHELRTPLTTFRLYTEMLTEGMVPDEEARRSYLQTLRAEADRLGHLVENVLAFARLERGRAVDRREVVGLGELLDRLTPSLATRAQQAGMELVFPGDAPGATLRTDVTVVGQILTNLVDNACKYARTAPDRRILLDLAVSGDSAIFTVRDHGPGVSRKAAGRLFRPFSKSAHEAAQTAPGVGLGLALSRRLARALGGDLRYEQGASGGACFRLTLPCDEPLSPSASGSAGGGPASRAGAPPPAKAH
jgi:signal transduction histidine kinase